MKIDKIFMGFFNFLLKSKRKQIRANDLAGGF